MPWKIEDVDKSIKGLGTVQKKIWVTVANGVLERCMNIGGDQKDCEVSAIRQANAVVARTKNQENAMPTAIYWEDSVGWVLQYEEDTHKLVNVEIFAVGKWKGDVYTEEDLDHMVDAFNVFKNNWTPVLKCGHSGKQEQPALGYITELNRVGNKLVATIANIPKIVYTAIKKGLFKRVSAEIFWNYIDGTTKEIYPRVLKALALLGTSIPAVSSLKELEVFFEMDVEVKEYDISGFDIYADKDTLVNRIVKVEAGVEYPKAAYLYVPDPQKPSTWKLRIWEDIDGLKKVTRSQLGRVAAALSPGGFRGQKVDIPTRDIKRVKDRLQELYANLKVKKEDMPKHIFEQVSMKGENGMGLEEVIKGLQNDIIILKSEVKEYEQKEADEKLEEYTLLLATKEAELVSCRAYKEAAIEADEKIKKLEEDNKLYTLQLNELAQQKRNADIKAYVQAHSVQGNKRILPKHEVLIEQILMGCSDVKEYSVDGVSNKMSLVDMVKKFVSELPELVHMSESAKSENTMREYGDSAKAELAQRTTEYMTKHTGTNYVDAMKAVLSSDPELKTRYFEYTMGVCE